MVHIGRYSTPVEAHLARLNLERHGIDCVLFDEYIVQMDWLNSDAVGGIRLMVVEDEAEEALRLLKLEPEAAVDAEADLPTCPKCGSEKIADGIARRIACLSMLILLSAPVACLGRMMRCKSCGKIWDPTFPKGFPWGVFRFFWAQLAILSFICFLIGLMPVLSRLIYNINFPYDSPLNELAADFRWSSEKIVPDYISFLSGLILVFSMWMLLRSSRRPHYQ